MKIHKGPPIHRDEIYKPQPPVEYGDNSVEMGGLGTFHGSDIKYKRDYNKCPKCGGVGRKWVVTGEKQRLINCECEYGKKI